MLPLGSRVARPWLREQPRAVEARAAEREFVAAWAGHGVDYQTVVAGDARLVVQARLARVREALHARAGAVDARQPRGRAVAGVRAFHVSAEESLGAGPGVHERSTLAAAHAVHAQAKGGVHACAFVRRGHASVHVEAARVGLRDRAVRKRGRRRATGAPTCGRAGVVGVALVHPKDVAVAAEDQSVVHAERAIRLQGAQRRRRIVERAERLVAAEVDAGPVPAVALLKREAIGPIARVAFALGQDIAVAGGALVVALAAVELDRLAAQQAEAERDRDEE